MFSDTLTVYRKEVRSYIVSPIPYVFTIIFTLFTGYWFFYRQDFFLYDKATMQSGFFDVMPFMLIFLVPAISMRLWSDETRGGTIEHLMTLPVSTASLVMGKFFAALTLLLVCLVLTAPIPITISNIGDLDWGPVLGGYLGALLLGGALLGLGLWLSALTQFQIVSFLITLVVGFALVILGFASNEAGSTLGTICEQVSLASHYQSLGRGVIDLRDLIYFVSFTVFFLYLNSQTIENRRYK